MSGVLYDVMAKPPSIGTTTDVITGQQKPVAFMKNRINGQYVVEGLSAGFMMCVGGGGFVMLDKSGSNRRSTKVRYLLLGGGIACIALAYNLCILFLRMKLPNYLR